MRAQVRTSVQQRDDGSTLGVSPLEDLLFQQHTIIILQCFIVFYAEGGAMFQAMQKVLFGD